MAESQETPQSENEQKNEQRLTSSGQPLFDGTEGKRFTSENQPSPEAKSAGQRRYWTLKKLLNQPAKGLFSNNTDYNQMAADYLGIPVEEVTIENVMQFRILERAIRNKDPKAYVALSDRVYGKPKQQQDEPPPPVTGPNDEETKSTFDLGNGIVFDV